LRNVRFNLSLSSFIEDFFIVSLRSMMKHESKTSFFKGAVARVCVIAPLFGIAQMFYYLGKLIF
jgi:hypothetical protein